MTTPALTAPDLFTGIGLGQFHQPGALRTMRLFAGSPVLLDQVAAEAEEVIGSLPASEVTRPGHVTRWTKPYGRVRQWSLLGRGRGTDSTRDDHDGTRDGKTCSLDPIRFPTLTRFVETFGHATNMRLNVLDAASGLSPHEEPVVYPVGDGEVVYRVRFHYPIISNPDAVVLLDGAEYHLGVGDVWYFNNGCVHAARNGGTEWRAHLVWDQWLTEETWAQMFAPDRPRLEQLDPTPYDLPTQLDTVVVSDFERQRDRRLTLDDWRGLRSRFGSAR